MASETLGLLPGATPYWRSRSSEPLSIHVLQATSHGKTFMTTHTAANTIRTSGRRARTPLFAAFALLGCAFAPPPAFATNWPVGRCSDVAGKGGDTLRIAIGKAGNFDTIDMSALPVTCSTITLTAGEIAIPQAYLTINGPADRTVTVSGNNVGRVLYHSGTGQLVLNGFEVAYGHSVGIGGCIWTKGRLYMSGMIASHCTGAAGGAVFANGNVQASHATIYANNSVNGCGGIRTDAMLQMSDSLVTGNSANLYGGGLCTNGPSSLVRTTITDNHAAQGRGGGITGRGLTMSDVVVDHNTSGGKGGGIDSGRGDNVRITRTLISDNVAIGALGGGIFSTNHDIEITDSAIVNNGGNGQTLVGGGMDVLLYADATNTISVKNTTISGNHSTDWGAGMAIANYENNAQSILTVANSTIAFNSTSSNPQQYAAGLFVGVGETHLQSAIIAHNRPLDFGANTVTPHVTSGSNNLIMTFTEEPLGTLNADPHLAPLALHGGALPVHALSLNSIAVDSGNDAAGLSFDQRGVGFARVVGTAADIGAYERQSGDDELFYGGFD